MKFQHLFLIFSLVFSSLFFYLLSYSYSQESFKTTINDSLWKQNYQLLKEYTICACIYSVPENRIMKSLDVSPSIYANILDYTGIDSLSKLATVKALEIKAEKYQDYEGKKASFFRCAQWVNTPKIDSLIRKYANLSLDGLK